MVNVNAKLVGLVLLVNYGLNHDSQLVKYAQDRTELIAVYALNMLSETPKLETTNLMVFAIVWKTGIQSQIEQYTAVHVMNVVEHRVPDLLILTEIPVVSMLIVIIRPVDVYVMPIG